MTTFRTPNFFIVGAAKSGTTSLWMYLKQHPQIFMPASIQQKEPAFFCNIYGYSDYESYLRIFSDSNDEVAIGEASHAYLTSPESAALIKDYNPDSKIIIILRDPVQRAFSLYCWMLSAGYEYIYPFESALKIEEQRNTNNFMLNNPEYFYNYLYFNSGLYFQQIKRYTDIFPRENIRIFLFDELIENTLSITQEIYSFLNVDSSYIPIINIYNKAQSKPFSTSFHYFLQCKLRHWFNKIRFPYRYNFIGHLKNINLMLSDSIKEEMKESTAIFLREKYKSDIMKTQVLIQKDLSSWLT